LLYNFSFIKESKLIKCDWITGRGKGMGMFSTRPAPATKEASACTSNMPGRLCKTRYNTTAPMYGVSLTSGQPVTIVQKFPDLLQQVVFEVCE
jgi:hypothetical protein